MLSEFKAFIARGNVMDLAVAVVIGAAFGAIIASLTDDLLMPAIGAVFGGLDFSSYFIVLGPVPDNYAGSLSDYAALKAAGVPLLGYGQFLTAVVNFIIIAFFIFLIVKGLNRFLARQAEAGPGEDILLLREIRDELKRRG